VMGSPPTRYMNFIDSVLDKVYRERESLIGDPSGPTAELKPRSTERAIVARMAVHADPLVTKAFTPQSIVDVEYERVGFGTDAKRRDGFKISPDLICHERLSPQANFLIVEVKCRGHRLARAWRGGPESGDLCKVGFFTHRLERQQPPGMRSYTWGLCLELDRNGADQWWATRQPEAMVPYRVRGLLMEGPRRTSVHFRRWDR